LPDAAPGAPPPDEPVPPVPRAGSSGVTSGGSDRDPSSSPALGGDSIAVAGLFGSSRVNSDPFSWQELATSSEATSEQTQKHR
jgi:hypothetical protein